MKKILCLLATVITAGTGCVTFAAPPVVSNVRCSQIAGTKNVEILYDVSDADGDLQTIGVQVSGDAGQTYTIPATALSGAVGAGVSVGTNRRIVWNAGADWNGQYVALAKIRVTASDGTTPAPPPGMAYIPAGTFQMGDNFNEGGGLPVHVVFVSGFFLDKFEVKNELFVNVATWASGHGYSISGGNSDGNGYPVWGMSWYEAIKWCNARSEKEGLTPVYYTDDAQTIVYRQASVDVTNTQVKWSANGYRLPTEAEWEKAARGGSLGLRYPWGNTVNGSQANYGGSGDPFASGSQTTPVGYYNGAQTPVGVDMANGYGIYDMAGNVWEWCWDWYDVAYYGNVVAGNTPLGPTGGSYRVRRGGSALGGTSSLSCAQRDNTGPANTGIFYGINALLGFRCARGQ